MHAYIHSCTHTNIRNTYIHIYIHTIKSWQAITDACPKPGKLVGRPYSIFLKLNHIIPSTPGVTKWLLSVVVSHPTIVWISHLFQECNMTRPSFLPLFCALKTFAEDVTVQDTIPERVSCSTNTSSLYSGCVRLSRLKFLIFPQWSQANFGILPPAELRPTVSTFF